jgi:hypothetical protein
MDIFGSGLLNYMAWTIQRGPFNKKQNMKNYEDLVFKIEKKILKKTLVNLT